MRTLFAPSVRLVAALRASATFSAALLWLGLGGSIHSQQKEAHLEYADLLFSQKQFPLAAQQYQKFVQGHPNSPHIQAGWFRMGECYLEVGQIEDALATFSHVVTKYKTGPFVGSAAYRVAVFQYESGNFAEAAPVFEKAIQELTVPEIKLQSAFSLARSYQQSKQPEKALSSYQKIESLVPDGQENPFAETVQFEMARLLFDQGRKDEAFTKFESLTKSEVPAIQEEALVRAGLMASENGDLKKSEEYLGVALKLPSDGLWKGLAQVGAIYNAYSAGDYDRVIGLYNMGPLKQSPEERAKVLLLVGNSFRKKGASPDALRVFGMVYKMAPKTEAAVEAGYRAIQIMHEQSIGGFPSRVEDYVKRTKETAKDSPYIDLSYLMLAEYYFNQASRLQETKPDLAKKSFQSAASTYSKVNPAKVDEKFHPVRVYKMGWSQIESGQIADGIITLRKMITQFPDHELRASALAKRALAHKSRKEWKFAIEDFQLLAKDYPNSADREFALHQAAILSAQHQKPADYRANYQVLLKAYPETLAKGEAHYWIAMSFFTERAFAQAIPGFREARGADARYEMRVTLRLALCHYQLEQISELAAETTRYLKLNAAPGESKPGIAPEILQYLGAKLFAENDFERAELFLSHVADPSNPAALVTKAWRILGDSRMKLSRHADAAAAFAIYIEQATRPSDQAYGHLQSARAHLCLDNYPKALESAQFSLRLQKEGLTNARARILLGDISAAQRNWDAAAADYQVVSQIFSDDSITPEALSKAAKAYMKAGLPVKAEEMRAQLQRAYPSYQETDDDGC